MDTLPRQPLLNRHPVRDAIEHAGGDDGDGQADDEERQKQVGGHISAFEQQRDDEKRRQHTHHDDDCVPINLNAENIHVRMIRPKQRM